VGTICYVNIGVLCVEGSTRIVEMSCQIKTVASFIDVDTVKRRLFPPDITMGN
jgi:hypothetical protein